MDKEHPNIKGFVFGHWSFTYKCWCSICSYEIEGVGFLDHPNELDERVAEITSIVSGVHGHERPECGNTEMTMKVFEPERMNDDTAGRYN